MHGGPRQLSHEALATWAVSRSFARVAGNQGANTPGVDGVTADYVRESVGVPGFLDDLQAALKDGSFRPRARRRSAPRSCPAPHGGQPVGQKNPFAGAESSRPVPTQRPWNQLTPSSPGRQSAARPSAFIQAFTSSSSHSRTRACRIFGSGKFGRLES